MALWIRGGTVVGPDHLHRNATIRVEGTRIASVDSREPDWGDTVIDASGAWVLPGFIDLHADYIEHMAAPRPTSLLDFSLSLREAERELLTHGITTMFHSLSFYGHNDFGSNPVRSVENSRRLIEVIHGSHRAPHQIRHRFHARLELDNVERVTELERLIDQGKVHLLSFMDHSPGQGQYRDLELYKLVLKGYRQLSDGDAERVLTESRGRTKMSADVLKALAARAKARGVTVASHDDDTLEKLDFVEELGTGISEFPITLEVAREAHRRGLRTVAGAPNVLLGGSHSGNLNAADAILDGCIDILCSDYYPASLLHAVFRLHRERGLPLESAVRLVTANPAAAVGLSSDLGAVAPGLLADLLVVRLLDDGFPVVDTALVGGEILLTTRYRT